MSALRQPPILDRHRPRPTAELASNPARPSSCGLRDLDGQRSSSAATEGDRCSALSERFLLAGYGFGPRPLDVEP